MARACSGGGEEVRRRPESEPRPRLRGASAWQSLLGNCGRGPGLCQQLLEIPEG